jgi:hypothetical protein
MINPLETGGFVRNLRKRKIHDPDAVRIGCDYFCSTPAKRYAADALPAKIKYQQFWWAVAKNVNFVVLLQTIITQDPLIFIRTLTYGANFPYIFTLPRKKFRM